MFVLSGINWYWNLDGWIVAAGVLCAVASALLGNFLVLRRMSMLGDAVSHAVLPGLAAAFWISSSRSSLPMFIGAVIVGVLTALFTEWIRGVGQVDEGASMGVVFTSLFAVGLVMIVQTNRVDLDAKCVLYGAIEYTPLDRIAVFGFEIPRAVLMLASVLVLNLVFVVVFFKELKLSSFDPSLATSMGLSAKFMHYALMILVATTTVASFESVGNILVVAMFVVPPAAAYLLTDRLGRMIVISAIIAACSAVLGHISAITVPGWFGYPSTQTSAMMAVVAGLAFLMAALFGPRHGSVIKFIRQRVLSLNILSDDIVALLFRLEERGNAKPLGIDQTPRVLAKTLVTSRWWIKAALWRLRSQRAVSSENGSVHLTEVGRQQARGLVRSHRLWEQYLASQASMDSDRLHDTAERLEHFTDRQLREQLDREMDQPTRDPHGTAIPSEHSDPTANR